MPKIRNKNQSVDQIKQQIQQAETNKSRFLNQSLMNSTNNVEFRTEADVKQVRQQIEKAEANKSQASSTNTSKDYCNNSN
ncbi:MULTISPECIES: gamma-type small acid-soluble spore protein [unclassified Lysinibacillus]|uniref:gamma-type small acid-soluble spore protein n=1 Tax=unclassified Lysinibacillus TaxID=2636778 RepID=UPI00381300D9